MMAPGAAAVTASSGVTPLAVEVRGLVKRFGAGVALDGLDLQVRRGEFVTLVGASGCGKSTLLNILAGLDRPSAGTVEVRADRISLMFQDATLLPWLTAGQNVELAMTLRGVGKAQRRDRVRELMATVRLPGKEDSRPHELSGGMRQRVALARMLAQEAEVVLMDEPFGALDAMTRDHMHDELESIWSSHRLTVLFVTHNVREAVRLGDRAIVLASSPGRVKTEHDVNLPRPRRIDSPEVSTLAARLTGELREDALRHVG